MRRVLPAVAGAVRAMEDLPHRRRSSRSSRLLPGLRGARVRLSRVGLAVVRAARALPSPRKAKPGRTTTTRNQLAPIGLAADPYPQAGLSPRRRYRAQAGKAITRTGDPFGSTRVRRLTPAVCPVLAEAAGRSVLGALSRPTSPRMVLRCGGALRASKWGHSARWLCLGSHRRVCPYCQLRSCLLFDERQCMAMRSGLRFGAYGLAALGVGLFWVYAFRSVPPAPKASLLQPPGASGSSTELIPDRRGVGHSTVTRRTDRRSVVGLRTPPTGRTKTPRTKTPPASAGTGKPKGPRSGTAPGADYAADQTGGHHASRPHRAVRLLRLPRRLARSRPHRRRLHPARRLEATLVEAARDHPAWAIRLLRRHRRRTHNGGDTACPVPWLKRSRHECVGGRFERRRDWQRFGLLAGCSGIVDHARHLSDILDSSPPCLGLSLGSFDAGGPFALSAAVPGMSVRRRISWPGM